MDAALQGMKDALAKMSDVEFVDKLEQLRIQYPSYILKLELYRRLKLAQPAKVE